MVSGNNTQSRQCPLLERRPSPAKQGGDSGLHVRFKARRMPMFVPHIAPALCLSRRQWEGNKVGPLSERSAHAWHQSRQSRVLVSSKGVASSPDIAAVVDLVDLPSVLRKADLDLTRPAGRCLWIGVVGCRLTPFADTHPSCIDLSMRF